MFLSCKKKGFSAQEELKKLAIHKLWKDNNINDL